MSLSLKERVARHDKLCGTIITLTDPAIGEIFGNAGYDFLWIDMEHTHLSYKDVLVHITASHSMGCASIVRVPQNDLTATKKVLEMGPDGIIFPMPRTKEEVDALMAMTLYPPLGTRGFGPMRAIGYGKVDAKEYTDKKSLDLCRFIQIEHIDAVNNLEEILKNPYIDGYIFGPNDLAGSIGELGYCLGENTSALIKRALEILKAKGKYIGLAGGFQRRFVQGIVSEFLHGQYLQQCDPGRNL